MIYGENGILFPYPEPPLLKMVYGENVSVLWVISHRQSQEVLSIQLTTKTSTQFFSYLTLFCRPLPETHFGLI